MRFSISRALRGAPAARDARSVTGGDEGVRGLSVSTMRNVSLNPARQPRASGGDGRADPGLVALRTGSTELLVAPRVGGSIAAYYERTDNGPLHWLRPATLDALAARDPLRMASFPLLPYCNRIRNGRFESGGQTIDLNGDGNTFAHALHGHAWRREWRVGARAATSVEPELEH